MNGVHLKMGRGGVVQVRVASDEQRMWREVATARGVTLSEYVRDAINWRVDMDRLERWLPSPDKKIRAKKAKKLKTSNDEKKGTTMQKIAVTIEEAVEMSGIGRSTLYKHMKAGEIPARKSGKRVLILVADLERFISGLPFALGSGGHDQCSSPLTYAP